jgi:hypothetical protein
VGVLTFDLPERKTVSEARGGPSLRYSQNQSPHPVAKGATRVGHPLPIIPPFLLCEAVGLGDGAYGDGVVDVEAAGVESLAVEVE